MKKLLTLVFAFNACFLSAQTTLYSEDFSGQIGKGAVGPGTTDVTGITTWSITTDFTGMTATTDWFQVVDDGTGNAVFEGRDVDVIQTWQSSVINVSGFSNLTITMDLFQTGGLDATDEMSVYYILDGGAQTLIGTYAGAFASPNSISFSGISGTTLQVVVDIFNTAGTERYWFDNVLVVGDNGSSTDVTNLAYVPANTQTGLSWTNPTGCSDEIMVVASTSTVTAIPSGDGSAYTANATYGSGTNISGAEYVVYQGPGNSFTINGLTNETQYCAKVFNRCGTTWSSGEEICFYPWDYRDTLVIMAYNVLNYPGSTANRWTDFRTIVQYAQPDIILCNEMVSNAGANTLLNNALNAYGITYYAQATFVDGPDSDNIMYYNTNKVSLATQNQIATALRDISHYQVNWSNVAGGTSTLDLYSLHLKASTGATNENKRLLECQNLRTHMDGSLPLQSNIIVGGDFNFYSAVTEPAWNELTNTGTQLLIDPKYRVGDWHDNSTFADVHTQSTRSTTNPGGSGGSTGGLDDRFDFLLVNDFVMNGGNGVRYIPNSYDEIGNDGNKFNFAIIENLPNTDVPDSVRDALFSMSDHLPVVLQIQIDRDVSVLPVELIDFYAIPNDLNQIELYWETLSEINNDYFKLQKSKNGITFETFKIVDGQGTSSREVLYSEIDEKPYSGVNYYRLTQVDLDGKERVVRTIAIHFEPNLIDLFLYPNPTNGSIVNVHCENIYERNGQIEFKNMLGQVVYVYPFETDQPNFVITLDIPANLTDEIYIVSVITDARTTSKKLVIKR
ncbi:MAG: T9SS type A sorting domain-containing protein [Putridiphycobacter sp.]